MKMIIKNWVCKVLKTLLNTEYIWSLTFVHDTVHSETETIQPFVIQTKADVYDYNGNAIEITSSTEIFYDISLNSKNE